LDIVAEGKLAPELVRQAIRQGMKHGLFTADELRAVHTSLRISAARYHIGARRNGTTLAILNCWRTSYKPWLNK
ncbi:MAG: hypothetical protein LC130_30475, partial [Bryobacterales bacterium]|nr:hypothetical protein [Bryobacterales bacterium]